MPDLQPVVDAIAAEMATITARGNVAAYIPELARVSPAKFGIAVVTADGSEYSAGDDDEPFSIQSIAKIFALVLALDIAGERVWTRVGREPSGSAFNSIVQLEAERGIPRNPFINAGAIVVADIIAEAYGADSGARDAIGAILRFIRARAGCPGDPDDSVNIDRAVALSEAATGFRNVALANYMKSFGNIRSTVDDVLRTYFHQCAIALSCRQLARATRFLAVVDPAVITPERARRIAALMLTCGHYDASGDFAFRVGLPAKSGVGGGIVALVPGRATIAVWSPGLGPEGNSVVGTLALERLAATMGWSVFAPDPPDQVNLR